PASGTMPVTPASPPARSGRLQARQSGIQFHADPGQFRQLLALRLDDLAGRVGDEFLVGEFLVQTRDLVGVPAEFAPDSRRLGTDVDKVAERYADGRLADNDLGGAAGRFGTEPDLAGPRQPADRRLVACDAFACGVMG